MRSRTRKLLGLGLSILLAGPLLAAAVREKLPQIGRHFVARPEAGEQLGLCMVSPGQMDKCAEVIVNGAHYTIAFRKRSWLRGDVVTYLHTVDPSFRSTSGARVGDTLFLEDRSEILPSPGFEEYAGRIDNGWHAVVGFNSEITVVGDDGSQKKVHINDLPKSGIKLRIVGFSKR
jgi:hypothetical protein